MTEYTKIVSEKISLLLQSIGQTAKLDPTVMLVQEVLPNAHMWLDEDVNVYWPVKGMGEVKGVLRDFAQKGVMLDHLVKSETAPRWVLKHGECRIYLSPDWPRHVEEGVSCRLVQVGTKTSEYPVYKLICEDKEFVDLTQQPKINEDDPRVDR